MTTGDTQDHHHRARQRVRVWFGDTPITSYVGDAAHAERYAAAMARRFSSLRITREPLNHGGPGPELGADPARPCMQGDPV